MGHRVLDRLVRLRADAQHDYCHEAVHEEECQYGSENPNNPVGARPASERLDACRKTKKDE